jgi:hypothetical protein
LRATTSTTFETTPADSSTAVAAATQAPITPVVAQVTG